MNGIVIQLQEEALNKDTDILTLLRKAYLIARKLKLKEFEKWIKSEQNGYNTDLEDVPSYRRVRGEIKAWNPYNGWIPVIFEKDIGIEEHYVHDSIANLVSVYSDSKNNTCVVNFVADMNAFLNKSSTAPFQTKYCLQISKNAIFNIFEQVKNRILDWAITLEENGIVGEGPSFTEEEQKKALQNPSIVNYTNNFYSSVDNSQIQQDSKGSTQIKKTD